MWTVIILIIILILAVIFIPFIRAMVKDKEELAKRPLEDRFNTLISSINQGILDGKGNLTTFDDNPRIANLMDPNRRNVLIRFHYSGGAMGITLLYKWYHVELKFEKTYGGLRDVNIYQQRSIGNEFADLALREMAKHRQKVENSSVGPVAPMPNHLEGMTNDEDPIGMIQDMYGSISREQKKSIVNLLAIIAMADGTPIDMAFREELIAQDLNVFQLSREECKSKLATQGESQIITDLKGHIDDIFPALVVSLVGTCANNGNPSDARFDKMISLMNKIGYTEDQIQKEFQKAMAIMQYFGG